MLLERITLQNFGIYKDENIFDLTSTKEKPIILCGGKNGGGKTTLFDSVMLCLYGQNSFDKRISKKEYDDVLGRKIHKNGEKQENTSIVIEFLYNHYDRKEKIEKDNHIQKYTVTRSWKKIDGEIIEKFTVEKNGEELKIDDSEWEKFIQELIPRGIARLFFFDGEKIATIAKQGGEDLEIKNSFESLLGLDIISKLKSDLEINLGKNEKKSGEMEEEENFVENVRKKIEELEEKKSIEVIRRNAKSDDIESIEKRIEEYELEISKMGGDYAQKRVELQNKKSVLRAKLDRLEEQIRSLCSDALPFSLIPKQIEQLQKTLKADQKVTKDSYEKQIISEQLDELRDGLDSSAFWKKIGLDAKAKTDVIGKIEEIFDKRLTDKKKSSEIVIGFSETETNKIFELIDKVSVLPKQLESNSKEFNSVTEELQKTETALENAPDDEDISPIIKKLNEQYEEIGKIKSEIRHIDDNIQGFKGEIVTAKMTAQKHVEKLHNSQDISGNSVLTKRVTKALDEYSQKLKEKKIQLLENYILESLKILFHKTDFVDKVSINKNTFEITLFGKDENVIRRDDLSEGEKQMFATSVLWALARTSGRSLPFIIDTPLARLDMDHRDNLVDEFFPVASHQTIILSTDSEISKPYYEKLKPYITRSYSMDYDNEKLCSKVSNKYFDFKEEKIAV